MNDDPERGLRDRYEDLVKWVLLVGDRLFLSGVVLAGFFVFTLALTTNGVIAVGPRSAIQSVVGSGVVAGLFSLISLTLTINQLISSRVFGALDTFQDKLEGGTDLRKHVSDIADHPSPPVDTAEFIAFTGAALQDEVHGLRDEREHHEPPVEDQLSSYVAELDDYAEQVQDVSSEMPAEQVISTLAGPDFAHHLERTEELQHSHYEYLSDPEHDHLDCIGELLGAISVSRQYYKTVALHQELAQLSREFIFVGFPAVAVALLVPLVYRTNPSEVLVSLPLEPLISAALTVVVAPMVLLMAYMLRISTIFKYTVSVAPFVPPVEWPW